MPIEVYKYHNCLKFKAKKIDWPTVRCLELLLIVYFYEVKPGFFFKHSLTLTVVFLYRTWPNLIK